MLQAISKTIKYIQQHASVVLYMPAETRKESERPREQIDSWLKFLVKIYKCHIHIKMKGRIRKIKRDDSSCFEVRT